MNGPSSAAPPRRIVVRGVNWLGDAVMSSPALLRLREAYPEAFILLTSPEKLAALWDGHPAVNAVLPFRPGEGAWRIGRRLRAHTCDIGIVFPNSFRSAAELWWARFPRRVGYGTQLRRWLLTDIVPKRPGSVRMRKRSPGEIRKLIDKPETGGASVLPSAAHHIYHYLHLVAAVGANPALIAPQLFVSEQEVSQFRARLQAGEGASGQPVFGLNPGAEYGPAKRWPAESFVAAARLIQERTNCRWLVFGGPGDVELTERIVAGIQSGRPTDKSGVLNLAGKTSLRELCAGLKACRVLLTNDTGPMHVAAAVGTPVVVPFGSTSAALTGPGLPGAAEHAVLSANVPCAPCFLRVCPIDFRCMRGIPVEQVIQAVLSRWAAPPLRS